MATTVEIQVEGALVATTMVLNPRTFKTGSVGYFGTGKVETGNPDERYQATISLVRIGSKPAAK
jgi:hypothetical protein